MSAAVGPVDHLPVPRFVSVAVGNWKMGPTPQIHELVRAGETKNEVLRSPSPVVASGSGRWMIDRLERVTMCQLSLSRNGTRGWKLSAGWFLWSGPTPRSTLGDTESLVTF